jgi:CRISPR/Cas system CMR subunit Cmr6 (Cas7 group RAMP superfamily)
MAKIKITESQLKMIAKHRALNEMMDEPELESNSKQYTMIWSVKGFTRVRRIEAPDPIVAYKKFMADVQGLLNWRQTIDDLKWDDIKLDERDEFKSVRDSNIQGVVYYFDGFLSDDEIEDILDRINKGNPHYQSNKKNSTEDMPGFEGTMNNLDNLSIRENEISLNEGQLLLKKVYTQFK